MSRKYWIIGSIVVLGLLGVGLILALGYYPIISVNGQIITAREFTSAFKAGMSYSKEFFSMASSTETSEPSPLQLQAVVLDQMVENILVKQELASRIGADAETLAKEKVVRYGGSKNLHEAASRIFKIPYPDLERLLLYPEARRELLMGRLFLEGNTYENWMKKSREQASVSVYSSEFVWANGKIQAR